MNEMDSVGVGIVEMLYNWLSFEVVGKCSQDVGKLYFAFPCPADIVIHDAIASYAHGSVK